MQVLASFLACSLFAWSSDVLFLPMVYGRWTFQVTVYGLHLWVNWSRAGCLVCFLSRTLSPETLPKESECPGNAQPQGCRGG
jgi:hypothetical protein